MRMVLACLDPSTVQAGTTYERESLTEFRCKNPRATIPETAFPEPYLVRC